MFGSERDQSKSPDSENDLRAVHGKRRRRKCGKKLGVPVEAEEDLGEAKAAEESLCATRVHVEAVPRHGKPGAHVEADFFPKIRETHGDFGADWRTTTHSGTLKSFTPCKGFGFVTADAGGEEVFAHIADNECLVDLAIGEAVTFLRQWDDIKGKFKCVCLMSDSLASLI